MTSKIRLKRVVKIEGQITQKNVYEISNSVLISSQWAQDVPGTSPRRSIYVPTSPSIWDVQGTSF